MIKAIAFDLWGCLLKENDIKMSSCEELLEKQFGNINFDDEYFSWACQFFSLSEWEVRSILLNLFPKLYSLRDLLIFEKILKRHPKITFAIASNHISLVRESLYALWILDKFEVILISWDCWYETL